MPNGSINFPVSTPIASPPPHYAASRDHIGLTCKPRLSPLPEGGGGRVFGQLGPRDARARIVTRANALEWARLDQNDDRPYPGWHPLWVSTRLRAHTLPRWRGPIACVRRRATATSVSDLRLLANRLIAEAEHVHSSKYIVRYRCVLCVVCYS